MAASDERVSGDAGKRVDDTLGMRAVELERLAEMACWSVGVVECWVSDGHHSITPSIQYSSFAKGVAQSTLSFSIPFALCTPRFVWLCFIRV